MFTLHLVNSECILENRNTEVNWESHWLCSQGTCRLLEKPQEQVVMGFFFLVNTFPLTEEGCEQMCGECREKGQELDRELRGNFCRIWWKG